MVMLTVFVVGFGVSAFSLIYGTNKFTWHLPRKIIHLAYWEVFGEINSLEIFESKKKNRKLFFVCFYLKINYSCAFRKSFTNWICYIYSACCLYGNC